MELLAVEVPTRARRQTVDQAAAAVLTVQAAAQRAQVSLVKEMLVETHQPQQVQAAVVQGLSDQTQCQALVALVALVYLIQSMEPLRLTLAAVVQVAHLRQALVVLVAAAQEF